MDLILWRHAQAEDGLPDLGRALTPRGAKDAARVGAWLRERLPGGTVTVLCSPATRTRQTAEALGLDYRVVEALAPGATARAAIAAIGWPDGGVRTVIVVGHNPWIGEVAARLVSGTDGPWPFRKAGVWWLSSRDGGEVLVKAVTSPEMLR